jgi:hypothetical protein
MSSSAFYKAMFSEAWKKIINLPEFKVYKPKALGSIFIKTATTNDWIKSNGLLSKEEITNLVKS